LGHFALVAVSLGAYLIATSRLSPTLDTCFK